MKRMRMWSLFISMLILSISCNTYQNKPEVVDIHKMLDYCIEKAKITANSYTEFDSIPRNINSHQVKWNTVNIHDWTSGFWPGILWYAYEASGDSVLLKNAEKYTSSLAGILEVPVDNHDLGFMLYCSYGNAYRITKDSAYYKLILTAADSLATLYNPKVGTILSWPVMREKMNWPHNTIVDNLMNLELLFFASKNSGNKHLYDIAVNHAETCLHTLIRPDYTTFHVAVFDTATGQFLKGLTHQGYSDNSMWARGQAWSIYGYTMCYRETEKPEFIEAAQKLADVFIERLPQDGIPYWDFDDPLIPKAPKDASAAAIAASGLLELSTLAPENSSKIKYKKAAVDLLSKLSNSDYLSGNNNQAFLSHSTGHKPNGTEIDASIIYADYYYLEALLRLKKLEN